MSARDTILDRIRRQGPVTLAEFMDIALYDPVHGYYATAPQRSGRLGDFITSVDVGPILGELLAVQFDEMRQVLSSEDELPGFDLVEAGAGNGRLTRDVLDAAERAHPSLYAACRVWLVERSGSARGAQPEVLAHHGSKLAGRPADLPSGITGVIFGNELLDAMPAHAVVMRADGLREIFIAEQGGRLVEIEGEPSTPALAEHFYRVAAPLPLGIRAEVSLAAMDWMRHAAAALDRGFLLLIDYGRSAAELYSPMHAGGTLMTYQSHTAAAARWLDSPGDVDMTTHVDLTALRHAAETAGLETLGVVDQTYFLTALGLAERVGEGHDRTSLARRLAAKTLVMPGGIGSTMKVLVFAKAAGRPRLKGLAAGRLT